MLASCFDHTQVLVYSEVCARLSRGFVSVRRKTGAMDWPYALFILVTTSLSREINTVPLCTCYLNPNESSNCNIGINLQHLVQCLSVEVYVWFLVLYHAESFPGVPVRSAQAHDHVHSKTPHHVVLQIPVRMEECRTKTPFYSHKAMRDQ